MCGASAAVPRNAIASIRRDVALPGTNRTGGGNSASGSGGPGTLPRRDDGTQDPPPINDWTAQVQSLAAKPALGTGWVEEGSLVQLNAAVYGLVNAPSAWCVALRALATEGHVTTLSYPA